MSAQGHAASQPAYSNTDTQPPQARDRGHWPVSHVWVNWALAALTVPVAAGAVILAVGKTLSMAVCGSPPCPDPVSNGLVYSLLLYGAPLVAALTMIASIFTATRRRGVVVPLCGLAALLADIVVTVILFRT